MSSSPFLVNTMTQQPLENFLETNETLVRLLLNSTYVDNIVMGANTEEAPFDLAVQSKALFHHGGFNLRKFVYNFLRVAATN